MHHSSSRAPTDSDDGRLTPLHALSQWEVVNAVPVGPNDPTLDETCDLDAWKLRQLSGLKTIMER